MPTRRERTLSKINVSERRCEHAMRREGTPGSAKAQIRGHRSIAVGTPRGRLTECSEVAAAFEHWGSRGVINGDLGDLCSSDQCPRLGL